ncbi:hypothetical protein DUI87_01430 [Hirundo rustica rustica]|uniref:Uncharacterized protein n=1 Tax=Hirundo rustica rustica TaxID=333673 RepID=A0A3M0L505_HIRRU|nr:hypothetical protein DUI87_01430 [Hirundo rustica rustica]
MPMASDEMHQSRAKVRVWNLVTKQWEGPYDLIALGVGMRVHPQILGYTGYLRSVFVLTCDRKGKIRLIGKLEAVTKMKVIK